MTRGRGIPCVALAVALMTAEPSHAGRFSRFKHGPPDDPAYFPIAVWLQSPENAAAFKAAGINLYVGLWKGPTEEQLEDLEEAGMPVICEQNRTGLKHLKSRTIVGWMHPDEPDNAQPLKTGKGYGPPVLPAEIARRGTVMRAADPTRPVFLNLGQGVAWDGWYGRGDRTNHPEDYPEYAKGCDIVSFDIYPVVHDHEEVAGKLMFVGRGVGRLVEWTGGRKIVWNCIEASRIGNTKVKPTVEQIRTEVWMSIVHGSTGIVYFVHQFEPEFVEASLLRDPDLLKGVTAINAEIRALAPVINSPDAAGAASVVAEPAAVPLKMMARRYGGSLYLFCVSMRPQPVTALFTVPEGPGAAEVVGENRTLKVDGRKFSDRLPPYGVRIYRMAGS